MEGALCTWASDLPVGVERDATHHVFLQWGTRRETSRPLEQACRALGALIHQQSPCIRLRHRLRYDAAILPSLQRQGLLHQNIQAAGGSHCGLLHDFVVLRPAKRTNCALPPQSSSGPISSACLRSCSVLGGCAWPPGSGKLRGHKRHTIRASSCL